MSNHARLTQKAEAHLVLVLVLGVGSDVLHARFSDMCEVIFVRPAWEIQQPPIKKCLLAAQARRFAKPRDRPLSRHVRGRFRVACVGDSATAAQKHEF